MQLCNYFKPFIVEGNGLIADTMKSLIYHELPSVFEYIDFDDDYPFMEPLLFAYFNREGLEFDLTKLMAGYSKTGLIDHVNIPEGCTEYLPNKGYFARSLEGQLQKVSPILHLDEHLSVIRYQHDLIRNNFRDNNDKIAEVEIENTTSFHFSSCQAALRTIQNQLSDLYEEMIKTNRNIILFSNPEVYCFSTLQTHGAAYLSTIPENGRGFFLEELIHQCAHNTFNAVLFDKQKFFKIDVEKANMGDFLGNSLEKRTIFSAFHGLFTVAKRYEAFYILYKEGVFVAEERHEFLGRFADLEKRFKTGLERLPLGEVFTPEGINFFEQLYSVCEYVITHTQELKGVFQLHNQPPEFSYQHFLQLNPLP